MKVLQVIASLAPSWGGPTRVVISLADLLQERGIRCRIVAPEFPPGEVVLRPRSSEYEVFPCKWLCRWWKGYSPPLMSRLAEIAKDFDLIHIHELWHYANFAAFRAAKKENKPFVITLHYALDSWRLNHKALRKKIYLRLIQRKILNSASAFQALTLKEAENIRAFGLSQPVAVIHNGIFPKDFENLPRPEQFESLYPQLRRKKVLLFLGRIHPMKGLDLLVNSFANVVSKRDDVALVVAGPDEGYRSKVERFLKAKGIREKAIFCGILSGEEKLAALSRADIFVLPSYSEGFSIAVLEALACGIPVVISESCNFPEVRKAKAGLVVDLNIEKIAQALDTLLGNRELRVEMGKNAKRLVVENFSWDNVADEIALWYRDVLSGEKLAPLKIYSSLTPEPKR